MSNTSQETEELYNLSNELSESAIHSPIHSEEEDEFDIDDDAYKAISYSMKPLATGPIIIHDLERFNLQYKNFHLHAGAYDYPNHENLYDIVGVVSIINIKYHAHLGVLSV